MTVVDDKTKEFQAALTDDGARRIQEALAGTTPELSIEVWENDVGAGWRPLIRGLDANLRDLDPDYRIGQVKEKFGGLRYYIDSFAEEHREEAYRLIRLAEEVSFRICENCGGPGERCNLNGYWVRTLCQHCQSELKRDS